MQSISRWPLQLCRRSRAYPMASGAPRWHPPLRARHDDRRDPVASCLADKLLAHLPRFAINKFAEMKENTNDVHKNNITVADDLSPADGICHAEILMNSSHRDGAIYKRNWGIWGKGHPFNLADPTRRETVSGLKKFSNGPCYPDQENCLAHLPNEMIQIFSLKLAKIPINSDSIQLYGYLAARDYMDGLLNYVFNRSRDNPIIVEKGSFIEMNGPRRGIVMAGDVLMEFDMRIRNGENEEDDIQLIDGVTCLNERMEMTPFTLRLNDRSGGAVDMCLTIVQAGMEAIIEVVISEVQSALDLSISSIVSITEEHKEIQLFHGAVCELCTKRFVVAAPADTILHLKIKIGKEGLDGDTEHYCSFDVNRHGCVDRQIKLEAACISVKMTVLPPLI